MYRGVLALATLGAASAFAPAALPTRAPRAAAAAKATQGLSMQRFTYPDGNEWDTQGADWAINGGIFGAVGDVIWAREAEVNLPHLHARRHRRHRAGPVHLPLHEQVVPGREDVGPPRGRRQVRRPLAGALVRRPPGDPLPPQACQRHR